MPVQPPPITGDQVLDSWMYHITQQINQGTSPTFTSGFPGSLPETGPQAGNTTIYLYIRTDNDDVTPPRPTRVNYDFANLDNVMLTADRGWTAAPPPESQGRYLWVTFRYVAEVIDEITSEVSWNTPTLVGQPGTPGDVFKLIYINSATEPATPAPSEMVPAGWSETESDPAMGERTYLSIGIQMAAAGNFNWGPPTVITAVDGDRGPQGVRGAGRWNYRVGTTLPSRAATTPTVLDGYLAAAVPGTDQDDPIDGDQLWIFASPSPVNLNPTEQRVYLYEDGTGWNEQEEVIDGDLLVTGTVTAEQIAASAIQTRQLSVTGGGSQLVVGRWNEMNDTTPDVGEVFFSTSRTSLTQPANGSAWTSIQRIVIHDTDIDAKRFDSIFGDLVRPGSIFEFNEVDVNGLIVRGTEFEVLTSSFTGDRLTLDVVTQPGVGIGTFQRGSTYICDIAANALGVVRVGDLMVDSTATPISGVGGYIASGGDITFGSTAQYFAWDASEGTLTIVGEIINITSIEDLRATDFDSLTASQANFTPVSSGEYLFCLVGAGGGGAKATGISNNRGSHEGASGGGAGGTVVFRHRIDNIDNQFYNVTLGSGGRGNNSNGRGIAGGTAGGTSSITFNSGGATTNLVTVNGGRGGTANGAAGGTASANTGAANLTVLRATSGGNAGDPSVSGDVRPGLTGGGAPDIFGNGQAACSSGNSVSSGGSCFGVASNGQVLTRNGNTGSFRCGLPGLPNVNTTAIYTGGNNGGNVSATNPSNPAGDYLGNYPQGGYGSTSDASNQRANASTGFVGGLGVIHGNVNHGEFLYGGNAIFGGGGAGGAPSNDSNYNSGGVGQGGNSMFGGGGGGGAYGDGTTSVLNGTNGGTGGNSVLFYLKIRS